VRDSGWTVNNMIKVPEHFHLLYAPEEISARVEELAKEISSDYEGKRVHLVCVLRGAVVFLADLLRCLEIAASCDFLSVASYGASTESSGVVRMLKDLDDPVEMRDVIIVEDIVDTGLTLLKRCCAHERWLHWPSVRFWTGRTGARWKLKWTTLVSLSRTTMSSVMAWILSRNGASCRGSGRLTGRRNKTPKPLALVLGRWLWGPGHQLYICAYQGYNSNASSNSTPRRDLPRAAIRSVRNSRNAFAD